MNRAALASRACPVQVVACRRQEMQQMRGGAVRCSRSGAPRCIIHPLRRRGMTLQRTPKVAVAVAAAAASSAGGVEVSTWRSPSGLNLEVLSQKASSSSSSEKNKSGSITSTTTNPPLVFVHGSYHAAWCWKEHFFQYFAERGHDVYAVSMRGQGRSDAPTEGVNTLEDHSEDITAFCATLSDTPPVLVGHSFGGLVVQQVMCQQKPPQLAGLALLASVPPSGNGAMVKRFLKKDLWASLKITYAFIAGAFKTNADLCRECFFSEDLPESLLNYMGQIATSSSVRLLDLKSLDASLPIPPPKQGSSSPPVCVIGGAKDFVVDIEGLEETAAWSGAPGGAVVLKDTAHDVMLDTKWEGAAAALERWMAEKVVV